MKNWIGKFLIGIGALHTLVGVALLTPLVGPELLADGLIATINGQPKREAFLWFLMSGFLILLVGGMVNFMEKEGIAIPKFIGWSLLAITILQSSFPPFQVAGLSLYQLLL